MVNETICVFCRLKPLNNENIEPCIKYENQLSISSVPPEGSTRNTKNMTYTFTKAFSENATQSEIFNIVAFPIVNDLLNKKNGLLFAHGVTGSGKTYTMEGNYESPGIVGRTIKSLFSRLNFVKRYRIQPDNSNGFKVFDRTYALHGCVTNKNEYSRRSGNHECKVYLNQIENDMFEKREVDNCTVFISMVEIYGNNITDLLISKNDKSNPKISICEDRKKNKYLHNVTQVEVQTPEEALDWYLEGQKRRRTAATNLNNQSSRSHCVFNIRLVRLDSDKGDDYTNDNGDCLTVNQLSLVDLAGSERNKRTGACGAQLKEAGDINNSLMELQKIMKLLREKQKVTNGTNQYIGYRAYALTHLFETSFRGGCNIRMIVCVQQTPEEYDETINVLTFAEEAKEIRLLPNESTNHSKISRMPPKNILISSKENIENIDLLSNLEVEINANMSSVERYRMISPKELNNDHEMMNTIMIILDILYKTQSNKDQLNSLINSCEIDDNSDKIDSLNVRLNNERLENNSLKRRLKEMENRLTEKDKEMALEIANFNKMRSKQDDKIKMMEEKIKHKTEDWEMQLKQIRLNDRELGLNQDTTINSPVKSVKVLAKKFEQVSNVNKVIQFTDTKKLNTYKRGFYNPYFRRSKSNDKYFQHKEKHEIPNGTLHKLNLKKRRSSKTVKLEDLQRADRYALQHQTVNGDNFQVDLHLGTIIPTAGNGVAVCFTETETIQQSSPFQSRFHRKRQSSVPSDISESFKRVREDDY